ncbi:V-type H+-transporting ATPase subunit a, partial [Tremellales sp. Uapishka_1]
MSNDYPSLFRSEEMSLVQLYIPSEVSHDTISELAEMGNFQFKDLNPTVSAFQRPFTPPLRRLAESARRLRLFQSQITALQPPLGIRPLSATPPFTTVGPRAQNAYDELEDKLKEHERRMGEMNRSWEDLGKRKSELEEKRWVLRETAGFFNEAESRHTEIRTSFDDGDDRAGLLEHAAEYGTLPGEGGLSGFDLEFVSGTIERSRMPTFERILWRVLRGNLYMNYSEIEEAFVDPTSGKETHKDVFIIFAHGPELLAKIRKVAESMGGTLFTIDSSADKRSEALRDVSVRLEDVNSVLFNVGQTRRVELSKIAEGLESWKDAVMREEEVYKTLNLLSYDQGRKTLVAEGWCPSRDITAIQLALRRATETAGTSVPPILSELRTHQTPPTFHRTTAFTEAFQTIIDSYGVATYQEVNPGLFTVITFPFLFAVMFGDIGHGFLAFLSGLVMIMYEKKLAKAGMNEILETFFFGRYIIILMGAFSMYTGLLYNDIFSKSLYIWHSGWDWPSNSTGLVVAEANGHVYPFGIDPLWHGSDNSLIFTNSYKMKLAIILGVIHMTFAICLQVPNHLHFKKASNIWTEFIPQILFLHSIFGYLVVCIIYKWSVDWSSSPTSPPALLNMLIYMFLSPGTVDASTQLYAGQSFVQVVLLLIALVCVPWMLCVKPYLIYKEHQKITAQGYQGLGANDHQNGNGNGRQSEDLEDEEDGAGQPVSQEMDEDHPFEMGDVIIHQVIHTIEFCLGCISNTASYLRLWALSLAHAQLSEVLYTMTIENAFLYDGNWLVHTIFLFVMFAMWFTLSIFVLCIMEGLSAFLHALRLHWVEANGKHYMAGGYPFTPLSFAAITNDDEA